MQGYQIDETIPAAGDDALQRPDGTLQQQAFDEAFYLAANPDVAAAVVGGIYPSGRDHWNVHGRAEGRLPTPGYTEGDRVDAPWYQACYPMVQVDIADGRAKDAEQHYQALGRHRGYRPNPFAARPDNPAATPSRFGGPWLDHNNAADLIEGKRQTGRLTASQARLLNDWVRDGYVILRGVMPRGAVNRAAADLQAAYRGEFADLRFECPRLNGYSATPWGKEVRDYPAKALDLHWRSTAIRELIFARPVLDALELIFERRVLVTQSLAFLHGSTQGYHQDTLYVPFSLPTHFAASWIALEDVTEGGGELTYYPGSHKIAEYVYGGRFKTLWDAQKTLRKNDIREEMANYSAELEERCKLAGLQPAKFRARKGDVLLWHADLVHGGLPITNPATRASVVTHYCPSEVASSTFELGRTAIRSHKRVAWYSSRYYTE